MTATVLLDLDGTLTDPFLGIGRCVAHALTELGLPVPGESALRRWVGPPLQHSFGAWFEALGAAADGERALALYRERFAEVGLYENTVYPGIPEALDDLVSAGATLRLATAKPEVFARRIVAHFGLGERLASVHGSSLDGARIDKVDLLAHVQAVHTLQPAQCIMVGDREHDARAARYHGMAAVGVLWGFGSTAELREAGAQRLISTPSELPGVLDDPGAGG